MAETRKPENTDSTGISNPAEPMNTAYDAAFGAGSPTGAEWTAQPIQPISPDWWRCLRFGPVSGRYDGEMTSPNAGKYALELRVDIDILHANSPVLNRVSGDIYQVYNFNWGRFKYKWRVYRESWIVDNPSVSWSRCSVGITGSVRYWKGFHLATGVKNCYSLAEF